MRHSVDVTIIVQSLLQFEKCCLYMCISVTVSWLCKHCCVAVCEVGLSRMIECLAVHRWSLLGCVTGW